MTSSDSNWINIRIFFAFCWRTTASNWGRITIERGWVYDGHRQKADGATHCYTVYAEAGNKIPLEDIRSIWALPSSAHMLLRIYINDNFTALLYNMESLKQFHRLLNQFHPSTKLTALREDHKDLREEWLSMIMKSKKTDTQRSMWTTPTQRKVCQGRSRINYMYNGKDMPETPQLSIK